MAQALLEPSTIRKPEAEAGSLPSLTFFLVVLLSVGVAWRVARYLLQYPVWGDEAFLCLNFLTRDYTGLLRELDNYQVAPIGFLWLEYTAYLMGGASELVLRFFPMLAGCAALLLFARLARLTLS